MLSKWASCFLWNALWPLSSSTSWSWKESRKGRALAALMIHITQSRSGQRFSTYSIYSKIWSNSSTAFIDQPWEKFLFNFSCLCPIHVRSGVPWKKVHAHWRQRWLGWKILGNNWRKWAPFFILTIFSCNIFKLSHCKRFGLDDVFWILSRVRWE